MARKPEVRIFMDNLARRASSVQIILTFSGLRNNFPSSTAPPTSWPTITAGEQKQTLDRNNRMALQCVHKVFA